MNSVAENSVEAVLQVLMLTAYADDIVQPEERETVIEHLPNLSIFTDDSLAPGRANIQSLINQISDKIKKRIIDPNRIDHEKAAISMITDRYLSQVLLAAMHQIALCDNEFHPNEKNLISLAASIWGHG